MTDTQKDLVLHFLREGAWAEAIAYYREETGADPETAEIAIHHLATRHGIRRFGQARLLALLVCSATMVIVFWWLQTRP